MQDREALVLLSGSPHADGDGQHPDAADGGFARHGRQRRRGGGAKRHADAFSHRLRKSNKTMI